MKGEMSKIIHIANRSRGNRQFFDSFLLFLAVEINIGSTQLNRDLELPSYSSVTHGSGELISSAERSALTTPRKMLPKTTLDALDRMLADAKSNGLAGCCDKRRIADFIISHTDLNDCHLSAINMLVLNTKEKGKA